MSTVKSGVRWQAILSIIWVSHS